MKEKQIYPIFKELNKEIGVFEIKLAKGNCIPFDAVKDHQIEGLNKANSNDGIFHKIADQTFGRTTFGNSLKKPFDCFYLKNIPAYIVICWYIPRKSKEFHYITTKAFLYAKKTEDRKSLTKERSREIAYKII